jgi:ribosomal protein S18 acetylase RimI-like enzyme
MAVHSRLPFFNRLWDGHDTVVRPATLRDAQALASLARRAQWSYFTGSVDTVAALLAHDPAVVLVQNQRMVALAQAGWRLPPNAWLRTVLVDNRTDKVHALAQLLPALHDALRRHNIGANFVTLDTWSEPWLRAPLEAAGYRWSMDVWSYNKTRLDVPSFGDTTITVRRAERRDLADVLRIDAASFQALWAKGVEILGPALNDAPYFAVAEWQGQIVGYSYVSMHGTWQAHLVRIAVDPAWQGKRVGVRLLADVVRFCRHQRLDLLTLNTQATNTHAQRLYEWFGFLRTGETQSVLGWTNGGAAATTLG